MTDTNTDVNFAPNIDNNLNMNDDNQLPLTTTDGMMYLLANENKLVSEDKRWHYDGNISKSELPSINEHNSYHENDHANNKDELENFTATHNGNDNDNDEKDKANTEYYDKYEDKNFTDGSQFNNFNAQTNNEPKEKESEEDIKLKKLTMLQKLADLANSGITLSRNYNMHSDLEMMKYEYNMHKNIRAKHSGIDLMGKMTLNILQLLEMGNARFDPFSLKLDGWTKKVEDNMTNYYDVFGELYEYHMKDGKPMDPHFKFLLMISGAALQTHGGHMAMNFIPGMTDEFNKNPGLEEELRKNAAADSAKTQQQMDNIRNQQHAMASRKASDLQMLKEKELEFHKKKRDGVQPTMTPPSGFTQQPTMTPPSGFNAQPTMTPSSGFTQQPTMTPPQSSQQNNISKEEFEMFKQQTLLNQHNHIMQMKRQQQQYLENKQKMDMANSATDRSLENYLVKEMESESNASSVSRTSINPNIEEIVNNTQKKIAKKNASYKVESVNKDDIDVISLGNRSKGTRSKGSRGSNKSKGINLTLD